jgi:hypothetical protein
MIMGLVALQPRQAHDHEWQQDHSAGERLFVPRKAADILGKTQA